MNKLLGIIFLLSASGSSVGQPTIPLPTVDGKINYTEVVAVDGAKKDELYTKAKLWLANTFGSSDGVILDDRESGVIIGKGVVEIKENEVGVRTMFPAQRVDKTWNFTIKIQLKDDRYKVDMYDIEYTYAMPENNIGHVSIPRNLDKLFHDKKMYKKDGSLKEGAPSNIAGWTNQNFKALLGSLKSALTEKVVLDDF